MPDLLASVDPCGIPSQIPRPGATAAPAVRTLRHRHAACACIYMEADGDGKRFPSRRRPMFWERSI